MKYFKLLSIITLIAALTACETEILYEDIAPEPLLVVNGLQHVGEPAYLIVEKSSFYINSETDFRVKDVRADLYVNGVFKETLQVRDSLIMESYGVWSEDPDSIYTDDRLRCAFNYCKGTYILCEGDELRFEVSSSEFEKTAVAETKMPSAPKVISFDTVRSEYISEEVNNLFFSLKIDDPVGKDYYNLYPKDGFEGFTSTDPVFSDFMSVSSLEDMFGTSNYYGRGSVNLFDDSYFEGQQYSVSMSHRVWVASGEFEEPFTLEVSRVDYDFYQYEKTLGLSQSNDSGLIGMFTEPTQVYSNVKNGVGLVGAQSLPVVVILDYTNNE